LGKDKSTLFSYSTIASSRWARLPKFDSSASHSSSRHTGIRYLEDKAQSWHAFFQRHVQLFLKLRRILECVRFLWLKGVNMAQQFS
jgi:hypothetical protein